jgi:hypothetical protein
VKRPLPLGRVQAATGDGERLDYEPGVPLRSQPRFWIEALAKVGRVRVGVVESSPHEYRPALLMGGIDPVDLERDVHRRAFDNVAGPCTDSKPHSPVDLDELVVHGQDNRKLVDDDRDPPDRAQTPTPGAKRSRQVMGLEPRTDRCYWRGSGTTRRRDGTSDRLDKEPAQVLIGVDTEHLLAFLDVVEPHPLEDSPVQLGDALDAAELAPGGVTRSPRLSPSPRRPGRRHDPQRRRLKSLALRQAPICRPVRLRCAGR